MARDRRKQKLIEQLTGVPSEEFDPSYGGEYPEAIGEDEDRLNRREARELGLDYPYSVPEVTEQDIAIPPKGEPVKKIDPEAATPQDTTTQPAKVKDDKPESDWKKRARERALTRKAEGIDIGSELTKSGQKTGMALADFFLRRKPTDMSEVGLTEDETALKKSGLSGNRQAINSLALYKQYEANPVTKNSMEMQRGIGNLEAIMAGEPSGAKDIGLVFTFMKGLDPRSVVRESEFETASSAGGLLGRILAFDDKIKSGLIFDKGPEGQKTRNEFGNLMKKFYNHQMSLQRGVYDNFKTKLAPAIGANAEVLDALPFNFSGSKIIEGTSTVVDLGGFSGMSKADLIDLFKRDRKKYDAIYGGLSPEGKAKIKEIISGK